MSISLALYVVFVAAVGVGRLIEMGISRRHQHALADRGIAKVTQPDFRWMVLLHGGVLIAAPLEVWLFERPFLPTLAAPMGVLFVVSNLLHWRVIRTLDRHWNVEVMDSLGSAS